MTGPQWFQFLLSYVLQVSLVVAVAFLLDRWTGAATTKAKVWTASYVSLLGLLAAGLLLPRFHWLNPWFRVSPVPLLAINDLERILGRTLLAVWLGGAAVMLLRSLLSFWRARKFVSGCPPISPESARRIQSLVPAEMLRPAGRDVQLRVSPEAIGPFCYQFHQPLVFLTESLLAGGDAELRQVLLHELAHLQTRHPMQVFLQRCVQILLWFHPLVWISTRRARLVREFVCDDAATGDLGATVSYLRALVRIVEQRQQARGEMLSFGRSPNELRLRAQRLLHGRVAVERTRDNLAVGSVLLAAVLSLLLSLPTDPLSSAESWHSPWPTWSARTLHAVGITAPDFPPFEPRTQVHELISVSRQQSFRSESQ